MVLLVDHGFVFFQMRIFIHHFSLHTPLTLVQFCINISLVFPLTDLHCFLPVSSVFLFLLPPGYLSLQTYSSLRKESSYYCCSEVILTVLWLFRGYYHTRPSQALVSTRQVVSRLVGEQITGYMQPGLDYLNKIFHSKYLVFLVTS